MKEIIHHAYLKKQLDANIPVEISEAKDRYSNMKDPLETNFGSEIEYDYKQPKCLVFEDEHLKSQQPVPWTYRRNPICGMQYTQKNRI